MSLFKSTAGSAHESHHYRSGGGLHHQHGRIPQVIKTLRTRHARDISIWQPLLLSIGVALWMVYGILIHDLPLILANIVPLICNVLLCGLKLHYDRHPA